MKNEKTEETNTAGRPVKVFRIGAVQASVFMNMVDTGWEKKKLPSVSFQKRYVDDNGQWQTTNQLGTNDVPKAVMVLNEAYRYLVLKERQ